MTTSQRLRALFIVLGTTLVASSCGTSASSICNDLCDCSGCSEEQQSECVDTIEDAADLADDAGCGDQVDDLLDCYGSELECRDGEPDLDGCESEAEAVDKCTGATQVSTSGDPGSGGSSPGNSTSSSSGGGGGSAPGGPSSSSSSGGGSAGGPPGASSSSGGDF